MAARTPLAVALHSHPTKIATPPVLSNDSVTGLRSVWDVVVTLVYVVYRLAHLGVDGLRALGLVSTLVGRLAMTGLLRWYGQSICAWRL